ncbi:Chromosome segregation ATPase-like protein [Pirellula staleyi DSM 6068]|uniref:Chromosome segregation ATPase-like protein n=1 Tax=Pirellula staleyi (strain ATCC 27377 / DSM 6068 / ICPB 4128) TaxID=530564 RepID=D2R2J8_PIRSD|nr:FHA domain-containing protein [Pirellula staleyi]ADB16838.1 Chromosome segregation ATPase-like protein [Pirellula staleyi DSM 6068]
MLTSANFGSNSASTLLGPPAAELLLRVRHPQHDGHVIRLRSSKCTIGSAEGCTLRLRAPGIRPLHAWILRSGASSVLICKTPDVQLNGRAVLEAVIAAGDTLKIGRIELEVLASEVAASPRELPSPQPLPPAFAAAVARADRSRLKRVLDVARQLKSSVTSEKSRIESRDTDLAQLRSHVHTALTQLTESQKQHAADQSTWNEERQQLRTTLRNLETSLGDARTQNSLLREQMTEAQRRAEEALQKLTAHDASREQQLTQTRSELSQLALQSQKFATERAELQKQADSLQQELSRARCESVEHTTELSQLVSSLRLQLESALAQQGSQADATEVQLQELRRNLALTQQQLASRDEQIALLQEELESSRGSMMTQQFLPAVPTPEVESEELLQLRQQLEHMSLERDTQSQRASATEEELRDARQRAAELEDRIELLENRLASAEQEHLELLEAQQQAAHSPVESVIPAGLACTLPASEVDPDTVAREAELVQLRMQLTETAEQVAQLESQLEAQLQARRIDREEAEARLEQLMAAHRESDAEAQRVLEELRAQLIDAQTEQANVTAELTQRLLSTEATAELLRTKLADAEHELAARAAAEIASEHAAPAISHRSSEVDSVMMTAPLSSLDLDSIRSPQAVDEFHGLSSTWQFPTRGPVSDADDHHAWQDEVAAAESSEMTQPEALDVPAENPCVTMPCPPNLAHEAASGNMNSEMESEVDAETPAQDVESVLARLMNSGVWKSDAIDSPAQPQVAESLETQHLPPVEEEPSVDNFFAAHRGEVLEAEHQVDSAGEEALPKSSITDESLHNEAHSLRAQFFGSDVEESLENRPFSQHEGAGLHQPISTGTDEFGPSSSIAPVVPGLDREESIEAEVPVEMVQQRPASNDSWRNRLLELQREDDEEAERTARGLPSLTPSVAPAPLASHDLPSLAPQTSPAKTGGGPGDEDESIEDYMARLLKRVRGDGGNEPQTASKFKPAATPTPVAAPIAATAPIEPVLPITSEEFIPRCAAPEQTCDLAAMRELANSAARSAISSHAKKSRGQTGRSRLWLTAVAGAMAVGCIAWGALSASLLFIGAGLGCLLLTGILGASSFVGVIDKMRLPPPSVAKHEAKPALIDKLTETDEIPTK